MVNVSMPPVAEVSSIVAIRTTPVNVALEAPFRWSAGYFGGFTRTVVEVELENGTIGIGEAPSHWAADMIDKAIAPRLIGADPMNLADCERRSLPPAGVMKNTEDDSILGAYGGVEMALWDLVGKLQQRSVAELLGGRVRDQVAFTEYFAPRLAHDGHGGESSPEEVARYCAAMAERYGAKCFEGKVGFGDLDFEVRMVREIRAAVGDQAMIRLDANMGWSLAEAREVLRRIEPYEVRSVEDPVRSLDQMRRLRAHSTISFSTHEPSLIHAAVDGVPDAIVLRLTALGGIRRTIAFINACEHFGVATWFHSPDTGIANAAYLQVAGATEWISEPSQTLLRWHTDDVIVGGPFEPRDGVLTVPGGPGLGVDLDRERLARCHRAFLDNGPFDPCHDPARPGRYGPRGVRVTANLESRDSSPE
jgi:glucarate dehydratase